MPDLESLILAIALTSIVISSLAINMHNKLRGDDAKGSMDPSSGIFKFFIALLVIAILAVVVTVVVMYK